MVFVTSVGLICTPLYPQTTAVSNLSQTFSAYVGPGVGSSASLVFSNGFSFTTGSTANSLSSVTLSGFGYGTSPTGFSLALYSGISAAGPSGIIVNFSGSSTLPSNTTYTYTPSANTTLSASTTYWLVASAPSNLSLNTGFSLPSTAMTAEDAGALPGWSIDDLRWSTNNGTSWTTDTSHIHQFSVQVTAIPETSAFAALLGVGVFAAAAWKRRKTKLVP